ncbi:MAG TPA: JAB domain-containing protein [Candidatus Saccharimonadales bacterium]|nr:JAB domain-containing protein [Candidatus Saccharimonadales bacterium]
MAQAKESHRNLCPVCERPIKIDLGKSLSRQEDILTCLAHFRSKKQEYLVCLSVSSAQTLITWRVITIGTLTSSLAHPREVFAGAIEDRAASVIIAHNHPSGDPHPSKQDISMTQQLAAAGQILGVPLQDHIVVSPKEHFSFVENQLLTSINHQRYPY